MRIIAGKFRGRNLVKSDHLKSSLRPTTDRNREALFNILNSAKSLKEISFKIENAKVLDVCCGSGAVGFEALSRGAKSVVFIDNNRDHLEIVKQNSEIFAVEKDVKIMRLDAKNLPENNDDFDLIFIDPPYEESYLDIVTNLFEKKWIRPNSLIVVEYGSLEDAKIKDCSFLRQIDSRKYGITNFGFYVLR